MASDLQPTWLRPGQSMRDYIAARQAQNILLQTADFRRPDRAQLRQLGRKSVSHAGLSPSQVPHRLRPSISRMTPAPPSSRYPDLRPIWELGDDERGIQEGFASLKRTREREMEPARFIDLRTHQARKRAQANSGPSGSQFVYRAQAASDVNELDRRMGKQPQKKMATQIAFKSPMTTFTAHMMPSQPDPQDHVQYKSVFLHKSNLPASSARKTAVALDLSSADEDETLESSDSQPGSPKLLLRDRARKAAHKSVPSGLTESSSEEVEDHETDEDANDESSDEEIIQMYDSALNRNETSTIPAVESESLIQLFRAFHLHTDSPYFFQQTKQLPFLLRNLRKSFRVLCRTLGIPSTRLPEDEQGSTLVRYEHLANVSFESSLPKWFCPLCDLFGQFETREMLRIHLALDHKNVFFEWIQSAADEQQDGESWRLNVLFPEVDDNTTNDKEPVPEPISLSPSPEPRPGQSPALPRPATTLPKTGPEPTSLADILFPPDEPIATFQRLSISPHATPKKPRPNHYPRPPPSSNRLGASARQPYLPAKSSFGGPDIDYSTRIGGPFLFDLLQLLPLESFGVLDWMVLDREEEIFADEELEDEQKVIAALWARWIMLNRNGFVEDKVAGVKMFIDEYWRFIHLAAGWQALVYQLLVLAVYQLLKHDEIVPLITHYESLVGMEFWDDWDSDEE